MAFTPILVLCALHLIIVVADDSVSLVWNATTNFNTYGNIGIDNNNTFYVPSTNGMITVAINGSIKNTLSTDRLVTSIASVNNTVYYGTYDTVQSGSTLLAISNNSHTQWDLQIQAPNISRPTVQNGLLYISSGNIHAILLNGTELWQYQNPHGNSTQILSPLVTASGVVVGIFETGLLFALNANGSEAWINTQFKNCEWIAGNNQVVFYAGSNNLIASFNENGTTNWIVPISNNSNLTCVGAVVFNDDSVHVGCSDGTVYAFDYFGSLMWTFTGDGAITTTPVIGSEQEIYFGTNNGTMYAIYESLQLWAFNTNSPITTSPGVSSDGVVVFGNGDKTIFAVKRTLLNNFNSLFFTNRETDYSCELLCRETPNCQGYIETRKGIIPYECQLASTTAGINISTRLVEYLPEYTPYIPFNCTAYTTPQVCFSLTKTCIACPEYPTAWQDQIESGFTVFFQSFCCHPNSTLDHVRDEPVYVEFNQTYVINNNNIAITSPPNVILLAPACPFFEVTSPNGITQVNFLNMHIVCPETNLNATQQSVIQIQYAKSITIRASQLFLENAQSGVLVLGGSQNRPDIIPKYSTTDLSNSYFDNITVESDTIPVTAIVSLAMYTGSQIRLGTFFNLPLIVVQPSLNDNGDCPVFDGINTANVQIFNISAFTQIFGIDYEISFSHAGAFAENPESIALRQYLTYQAYLFLGLLALLLILHQDLLYYYKKNTINEELLKKEE